MLLVNHNLSLCSRVFIAMRNLYQTSLKKNIYIIAYFITLYNYRIRQLIFIEIQIPETFLLAYF